MCRENSWGVKADVCVPGATGGIQWWPFSPGSPVASGAVLTCAVCLMHPLSQYSVTELYVCVCVCVCVYLIYS